MAVDARSAHTRVLGLQEALEENRKKQNALYQRLSKSRKRLQYGSLGPAARKTTIAVFVLSEGNVDLAWRVARAMSTSKDPKAPGHPTKKLVEDLLLAVPFWQLTCLDETAEQRARRFLAEAATVDWVRYCNLWHGVAPSSMDAFLHWEHELFGRRLDIGAPSKRYANKWAQRWRARWGVRRKILRQSVHRDPAVLRKKVDHNCSFWVLVFLHFPVLFLGPESVPKSGSALFKIVLVCLKRGPVFGPLNESFWVTFWGCLGS